MFVQSLPFVKNIYFKGNVDYRPSKLPELKSDTFERTTESPLFSNETFNTAIETVKKTALGNEPKESLTLIVNDSVFGHEIGDIHSVQLSEEMENIANSLDGIVAVHSHTASTDSGLANPVSLEDFVKLVGHSGLERVYSINPSGEYSVLKKVNVDYPITPDIYNDCLDKLDDEVINVLNEDDKAYYLKLLEEKNMPWANTGEVVQKLRDFRESDAFRQATLFGTHNFWVKYASNLGLDYETNYSYL